MRSIILFALAITLMACGEQASSAADAVSNVTEAAGDAVSDVTEAAGDAATDLTEAAGDAASSAAGAATGAMESVKDAIKPSEEVTATIDAVKSAGGDITALPAEAAVGNIDTWIGKLSSMEGTEDIVASLGSLKTELTSGDIDGGKVSGILTELASKTRELGDGNMALGTIAGALEAGAKKLGGE